MSAALQIMHATHTISSPAAQITNASATDTAIYLSGRHLSAPDMTNTGAFAGGAARAAGQLPRRRRRLAAPHHEVVCGVA